jgi:hypothetical protein
MADTTLSPSIVALNSNVNRHEKGSSGVSIHELSPDAHPRIPNGINSVNGHKSTKRRNGENGYYRNEELGGAIHTERSMRVIVIGSGASALCFAYKLQRSFENFSLKLYEKNSDISGTWYENRYPGKKVPSFSYVDNF